MKVRDEGLVRNKVVRIALAITSEGSKEVLWLERVACDTPNRPAVPSTSAHLST